MPGVVDIEKFMCVRRLLAERMIDDGKRYCCGTTLLRNSGWTKWIASANSKDVATRAEAGVLHGILFIIRLAVVR